MNREILFRGYDRFAERWAYGYYRSTFIMGIRGALIFEYNGGQSVRQVMVIPETVGQYTGFMDRNGERIFEGDLIEHDADPGGPPYIVAWCHGAWMLHDQMDDTVYSLGDIEPRTLEVVGNTHDNPELVKEKRW